MATIGLIWASSLNGAIGKGGDIPWSLPEDLKRFKTVTSGSTVVMGRRTWESLPFKPLPGRDNLVLTSDPNYVAPGATVVNSMPTFEDSTSPVWVIGGSAVYQEALKVADVIEVTDVDVEVPDADAFAPTLGDEWVVTEQSSWQVSTSGVRFRYRRLVRSAEGTS